MSTVFRINTQNYAFPQYKTLTGNSPEPIEDRAVKFGCSTGFSAMVDQTVWLPSLLRDDAYRVVIQ